MAMDKQLSVRLSDEQRLYVKEQLKALQRDPQLAHFRWSEGDIVRTFIEEARKNGRQVAIVMAETRMKA
jgi:pyruvate/oxaloacetate carboxyltransferase